ncbi:MAG: imidazole glycerol phosphate synthase subunit HisH [Patescibacteria group bacterium]
MIAIVDYGSGNLGSLKKAFDYLGADSKIISSPKEISGADKIVLPGVGSFGYMMEQLRKKKIDCAIKGGILSRKPFLGICLGMQGLFEESEESAGAKGLGIFTGKIVKFKRGKVPQIGWNKVKPKPESILQEGYFYFVNSYYAVPQNPEIVEATTDYFGDFASAVRFENITGVQFHPEKSGKAGLSFLKRWIEC